MLDAKQMKAYTEQRIQKAKDRQQLNLRHRIQAAAEEGIFYTSMDEKLFSETKEAFEKMGYRFSAVMGNYFGVSWG